jgi:hypothetical protein
MLQRLRAEGKASKAKSAMCWWPHRRLPVLGNRSSGVAVIRWRKGRNYKAIDLRSVTVENEKYFQSAQNETSRELPEQIPRHFNLTASSYA